MPGDTTRAWSSSSTKLAVLVTAGSIGVSWFILAIWLLMMVAILLGVFEWYFANPIAGIACDRPNIFRSGGAFYLLRFHLLDFRF